MLQQFMRVIIVLPFYHHSTVDCTDILQVFYQIFYGDSIAIPLLTQLLIVAV